MKFYRFMSMKEFNKMSSGADITGKKSFEARTTSTGVCFLAEKVVCHDVTGNYTLSPEKALDFLYGVVDNEVLVEFNTDMELRQSTGVYASLCGGWCDTMTVEEYCIPSYNRNTMKPLRYGFVELWNDKVEWYPFN